MDGGQAESGAIRSHERFSECRLRADGSGKTTGVVDKDCVVVPVAAAVVLSTLPVVSTFTVVDVSVAAFVALWSRVATVAVSPEAVLIVVLSTFALASESVSSVSGVFSSPVDRLVSPVASAGPDTA
jgi:hypothetical protein